MSQRAPTAEIIETLPQHVSDLPIRRGGIWRFLRKHPAALVGLLILIALTLVAIFAPWLAPYGAHEKVGPPYEPPSWQHPLGLDDAGVDMFSLMIYGTRISLLVGFTVAALSMAIGVTVGVLVGYHGGKVDLVVMRVIDYLLVLPSVVLLMVVAAVWGGGLLNTIIILALLGWTWTALIVRAQAKSVRERVYVLRARSIGASNTRIIWTHVLPHVMVLQIPITVYAIADAIGAETGLAFLGLGDPVAISWGRLLENAFAGLAITVGAWWAIVPPGVAVALVVIATTMLGRGLESSMNVKLEHGFSLTRSFRVRRPAPSADAAGGQAVVNSSRRSRRRSSRSSQ